MQSCTKKIAKSILLLGFLFFTAYAPVRAQIDDDETKDPLGQAADAMKQRRFLEAEKIYAALAAKNPGDITYKHLLSHALMYQKKYRAADSILRICFEQDSTQHGTWWYKGLLAEKKLDDSAAIVDFKAYVAKAENTHAFIASAYLHIGSAYRRKMRNKGINSDEISNLIFQYETYMQKNQTDPQNSEIQFFIERLKTKIPVDGGVLVWNEID